MLTNEGHGRAGDQHAEAGGRLDDDVVKGHPAGVGRAGGRLVVHVLQLIMGHVLLLGHPAALRVHDLAGRAAGAWP